MKLIYNGVLLLICLISLLVFLRKISNRYYLNNTDISRNVNSEKIKNYNYINNKGMNY